ncbi:unnamed protein product, partial [Staurois parvus]
MMSTDRWHFWGHTDHQGTLIISALMISVHVPSAESRLPALLSSRAVSVTARERSADNRHFRVYMVGGRW